MLAVDNFVHTDLHPGNIMVTFVKPEQTDSFWKHLYVDLPEMFDGADLDAHPTIVVDKKNGESHAHYDARPLLASLPDPSSPEFAKAFPDVINKLAKQGYRPHLILLDCGLTATLRTNDLKNFLDLFRAVCERKGYRAGQLMVERSRQPETCTDKDAFAREVDAIVKHVFGQTLQLQNIGIGDILTRVMNAVRKYHVQFEGDFVNIVVSIVLVEGIGRRLDPDLDLIEFAGKYLSEVEKRLVEVGELTEEERRKNMENIWKVKAATAYRGIGKKLGFGSRAPEGAAPGEMEIDGERIRLGS
jgi:aarF domain-containing kinase